MPPLGGNDGDEEIYFEPVELKISKMHPCFSDQDDGKKKYGDENPFKRGRAKHEGYQNRTLIVDNYQKNLSIYSSHRVV